LQALSFQKAFSPHVATRFNHMDDGGGDNPVALCHESLVKATRRRRSANLAPAALMPLIGSRLHATRPDEAARQVIWGFHQGAPPVCNPWSEYGCRRL